VAVIKHELKLKKSERIQAVQVTVHKSRIVKMGFLIHATKKAATKKGKKKAKSKGVVKQPAKMIDEGIPDDFLNHKEGVHGTRVSKLCFNELVIDQPVVWTPNLIELMEWSNEAVRGHTLENLLYYKTPAGQLIRLTFQFADGRLAPPQGTYNFGPTHRFTYPSAHVATMEFHINNSKLYSLAIKSQTETIS
jgi:hypothetical protein